MRTRGAENFVGAGRAKRSSSASTGRPKRSRSETTREGIPVYAATSRNSYGWTTVIVVRAAVLDAPLGARR